MNHTKNFIKAYNFNKDKVHNNCILRKTPGDVFAADIYAHKICLKKCIEKYVDNVEKLLQTFNAACQNQVNEKLSESGIFISILLIFAMIIFLKQKSVLLNLIYMLKHCLLYTEQNFDLLFLRIIH